jgi:hypothetical protein
MAAIAVLCATPAVRASTADPRHCRLGEGRRALVKSRIANLFVTSQGGAIGGAYGCYKPSGRRTFLGNADGLLAWSLAGYYTAYEKQVGPVRPGPGSGPVQEPYAVRVVNLRTGKLIRSAHTEAVEVFVSEHGVAAWAYGTAQNPYALFMLDKRGTRQIAGGTSRFQSVHFTGDTLHWVEAGVPGSATGQP